MVRSSTLICTLVVRLVLAHVLHILQDELILSVVFFLLPSIPVERRFSTFRFLPLLVLIAGLTSAVHLSMTWSVTLLGGQYDEEWDRCVVGLFGISSALWVIYFNQCLKRSFVLPYVFLSIQFLRF